MATSDSVLASLQRCARWAEVNRASGYVSLIGIAPNGQARHEDIDEKILTELLKAGKVEMDNSQRLQSDDNYSVDRKTHEVTQKYWRVLP